MILFDYDKAVHLMKQWGVDVLLPHTLLNAGYLADHWKHDLYTSIGPWTTFDRDEPYQLFVGLPQDRKIEPFVTCRRASEEGDMYNWDVWIEDRRVWGPDVPMRSTNSPLGPAITEPYLDPFDAAADALCHRGLDKATIGIERRFLGIEAYEKLQGLMPQAQFREVLGLFDELRMLKTPEEIRRMRFVAKATQEAYRTAFNSVRAGMTGLDFERIFGAEHYRRGVRHEWLHTMIGPLGIDVVGPNATLFTPGQTVCVDGGASYRHYQSDLCMFMSIGEPSTELLKIYKGMRRAMDAVLELLRPGVKLSNIFETGNGLLQKEGLESYLQGYIGHGVGRNVHEEPVLGAESDRVLVKGMTLSIEFSTRRVEWGAIGLEDGVVITEDGYEDLSTIGRELHVTAD